MNRDRRRPHELSDAELRARVRAIADEGIAQRGRPLTEEECRATVYRLAAEARDKRGYDLSPDESRKRFQAMLESWRNEPAPQDGTPSGEYRFEPAPSVEFVVRESSSGETQLDRIERRLERGLAEVRERMATRVQVEDLRDQIKAVAEQYTHLEEKIDTLSGRVEAIERRLDTHDLRLLRLERAIGV